MRNTGKIFGAQRPSDWKPRVIFLNGPPHSGKTTIARALQLAFGGLGHESFSKPLRRAITGIYGIPDTKIDKFKDTAATENYGVQLRRVMIAISEQVMKPLYGDKIFGKMCADRVMKNWRRYYRGVVISDCGFGSELDAFLDEVPHDFAVLIRLARDGCSFADDSRDYVYSDRIPQTGISNNGTVLQAVQIVRNFLAKQVEDIRDTPR